MSPRGDKLNKQLRTRARGKILRSALIIFARFGYHGSTMKQIMEDSGMSKGLLYHYYPSKERLFIHLVEKALAISERVWQESLETSGTAWERISRLAERLIETAFTEENSLYYLIMMQAFTQGAGIPGVLKCLSEHTSHYELLPPLIRAAQKSGDVIEGNPEVLASSFNASFLGYTLILMQERSLLSALTPEVFLRTLRKQNN